MRSLQRQKPSGKKEKDGDELLLGALPTWPYSAGWGYFPSGILGLIVIIVIILIVAGRV